ncbi:acyl-CoA dehydrogenase family protein [Actinocorallia populi]|uniref:acyl-CoA dehydrogenase family protein n=1 Tax=Actinocorallia populi TaxID=2079200 RepID=UPI000D0872DD|nr:acyl-CoA dehydrogenase family protein [Actinocorallia populi]
MSELLYGEVEEELRAGLRGVLADRAGWQHVLAWTERDETHDAGLWRVLGRELGCAGLPVPEELGGSGAGWRETAVVAEELGRAVAPVPFLGGAVLGVAALLASDDRDLLASVAAGEAVATLAVPYGSPERPARDGKVTGVADALAADVLLLPQEDGLYAYDAPDVTRTPLTTLDRTRPLADLDFGGARGRRIGGTQAVGRALTVGAAILASEQLGVAEQCLETTVAYVRTRYQFARPIGSYQAVKHRLADLWVAVAQARAVARHAADCVASGGPDTPVAVAIAQSHCSEVVVHAAEQCVQLHGGIGFTWEHPAHLYLKRAKSLSAAFGGAHRHRAALGGLVDLAP